MITDRDKEMIKAMAIIKKCCHEQDECRSCPMFNICDDNKSLYFPCFWNIPEV